MRRRAALLSIAGLTAACASADRISFDRGEVAITFTKLVTAGLLLLDGAIRKNTKAGVPNEYAMTLTAFAIDLRRVQERVEQAILEAPTKSRELNASGLGEVVNILSKAIPLILPLLAAV